MKILFLIITLSLTACKFPNFKKNSGSGGGGGGRVPTVDQLQDWLNKGTSNPTRTCDSENTGNVESQTKYPKIYPYGKSSWTDEYSKIIYDGLSSKEYSPLLTTQLNENDLNDLGCSNFNHMSDEDKKKFWIILFASMSKAESGFDTTKKYEEGGNIKGTISTGLLQISKNSASAHCSKRMNEGRSFDTDDLIHPVTNIKCSMHIMMNQILGNPLIDSKTGKIRQTRPTLKGRILTGNPRCGKIKKELEGGNPNNDTDEDVYYWAVLDRCRDGYFKMANWIRPHIKTQIKSCEANPLVADDNYEKPKCDNTVLNENRRSGKVCFRAPCPEESATDASDSTESNVMEK